MKESEDAVEDEVELEWMMVIVAVASVAMMMRTGMRWMPRGKMASVSN